MSKIWEPQRKEISRAFWVACSAEKFLDAYLENRLDASIIKSLAADLHDLKGEIIGGCQIEARCSEISDVDWSKAKVGEDGMRYIEEDD